MTTKIGKIAVAATLVALTHSQLASAAPRTVEQIPTIDLPAGLGCSFPLRIEATDAMARVVTFEDQNGEPVRIITARTGVVLSTPTAPLVKVSNSRPADPYSRK
jgi:hypothetical protein